MNYNDLLLDKLKSELLDHPLIKQISLSKNQKWMQSNYQALAKALSQELEVQLKLEQKNTLGTTISVSTLERIFKHGYKIPTPVDGRRLKTLNKLSIVLGYKDWNVFSMTFLKSLRSPFSLQDVKLLIQNALQAEYNCYKNIPKIDTTELEKYYNKNGSAFSKILSVLENAKQKGNVLKNKHNPSTFELLDIALKKTLDGEIIATTSEYWYLSWYNTKRKRYEHSYNVVNEQIYILTEIDKEWKIRVNIYNATKPESPREP